MPWLRAGALLLTAALSFLLHHKAGFSLPEPWPDEVVFLWPAKSLAEQATLLAPQLNGSRPILWMPPGYTVAMAAVIRLASLNLSLVRWVSWIFSAAALLGLFLLHQRQRSSFWSLPLLVVIAIAPAWVVVGNVARMEALLFCTSIFGFALLSAGRLWKGIAVLALGVLIHPNGLVFLASGGFFFALAWRHRGSKPSRSDWLLLALVGIGYLAYGLLAIRHFDYVIEDMRYQFARKKSQSMMNLSSFVQPQVLPLLFGFLGAGLVSWRLWGRVRASLWLAAASCAIPIIANEMWYLVFGDLGLILLLAEWIDMASKLDLRRFEPVRPGARFGFRFAQVAMLAAICGGSLRLVRWKNVTESPRNLPGGMSWEGMRMQEATSFEGSERLTVNEALGRLVAKNNNRRVVFDPPGDALLLQPTQSDYLPFFPVFTAEKPALVAVHVTPHWGCCGDRLARVEALMREKKPLFVHKEGVEPHWFVFAVEPGPADVGAATDGGDVFH